MEAMAKIAKYIFLDVVKFTQSRSVEAQTDIIEILNDIIRSSVSEFTSINEDIIFLPTGDGICIVILNNNLTYDIHITIALDILGRIHAHNNKATDRMRKFEVRIGVNTNIDNLVIDVNGNRNIAGAGINIAQRVMSQADGGQIFVGQSVFDILQHREKYMNSFRAYLATVKHEVKLPVYQYIGIGHPGLNLNIPTAFIKNAEDLRLTQFQAYYLAHAIKNRKFILESSGSGQHSYASLVLLWFLANDSVEISLSSDIRPFTPKTPRAKETSKIEEQFAYLMSINFWVCCYLSDFIVNKCLENISQYFNPGKSTYTYHYVNTKGVKKLKLEWPDIWKEFGLGNFSE